LLLLKEAGVCAVQYDNLSATLGLPLREKEMGVGNSGLVRMESFWW